MTSPCSTPTRSLRRSQRRSTANFRPNSIAIVERDQEANLRLYDNKGLLDLAAGILDLTVTVLRALLQEILSAIAASVRRHGPMMTISASAGRLGCCRETRAQMRDRASEDPSFGPSLHCNKGVDGL